jgi:uncharacterized membrane protein YfcA
MAFLEPNILIFLLCVALLTGFVKTGIPVLGGLIAVMMVIVFPPKDALGITLLYLIAGDLMAVYFYRKQANYLELRRLLPMIFVGIGSGILVLKFVNNEILGLIIGVMILFFVSLEPFRARVTEWAMQRIFWVRLLSGWLAGLATTVGNAAGPVISLYFLLLKLDKSSFAGTAAMFYITVNFTKLPLFYSIGIFKDYYLWSVLATIPFVFIGGYFGRRFLRWIPQQLFTKAILMCTGLSGLVLIVRYFL